MLGMPCVTQKTNNTKTDKQHKMSTTSLYNLVACTSCNQIDQNAKRLPCRDVYCGSCLENLFHNEPGNGLVCTKCGTKFDQIHSHDDLPVDGLIKSLSRNPALQKYVQEKRTKVEEADPRPSIHCSQCLNEAQEIAAEAFCLYCLSPLCKEHAGLHQRERKTKDHFLLPVGSISNIEIVKLMKKTQNCCTKHSNEKLKFLCDCDELICADCALTDHKEHKFMSIAEAEKLKKLELKEMIQREQQYAVQVENSVTKINELMGSTEKRYDK